MESYSPPYPLRPLLVRFGAVGDMINATALAAGLAESCGAPCDVVTVAGSPARVLDRLPFVGEVFTLHSRRTPYLLSFEQQRLVRWLRRRGPSPAWVAEERDGGKVDWLLERGGLGPEHRATMRSLTREPLEHVVDYLLRLGRQVPLAYAGARAAALTASMPRLALGQEELEDCRRWLDRRGWAGEPLVLAQPTARRAKRGRWPLARWQETLRAIREELPAARVVLCGTGDEQQTTRAISRACADPRVDDAAGELPLRRLFALLSMSHSLVSLDTGPAHAAAALGCPVVVIAGRADPRRNRPFGPPERARVVTLWPPGEWPPDAVEWWQRHDISAIPSQPVVEAWRRVSRHARPSAEATT
ncbi:MAG TPA: glycosyltransferase family 9 protein [Thermoanaerobaculia bacterium]|nr:glycosyltransferase family 9 protein [Thermoanaerobaculia bacterium]